ncbi:hypothetical protein [Winogradskyella sp.]|uniref:hypothetical protein n=1 Tax=Winogradskyella sp. TaxID=1883156 RepID=UPI003BAD785B
MNQRDIYTVLLAILIGMTFSAQNRKVQQEGKPQSTINQADRLRVSDSIRTTGDQATQENDEAISRETIKSVSVNIKKHISKGEIKEAEALLRSYKPKCEVLKSSKLCLAGLDFHRGYLYQQTAKLRPNEAKDYKILATKNYEKVLSVYPGNRSSLDNLIILNSELNRNMASVEYVKNFVEQYPSKTVQYFLRMGDLFLKDENFEMACDFYQRAYKKDPRSERACKAVVSLYTRYEYACELAKNVRKFALDCRAIGLANYSEELLRKEFVTAVEKQDTANATESMILWASVLAENNWLYPEKIKRTIDYLFPEGKVLYSSDKEIKRYLEQLSRLTLAETVGDINSVRFWKRSNISASVYGDWEWVTPRHVLLKEYYAKGESAYFKNEYKIAERLWRKALDESYDFDKVFFSKVAIDLAKLYHSKPEMDRKNKKLNDLVRDLFQMKGQAYAGNDLKMIRNYHITLGGIFYDKQIWEGDYFHNARFQLERALSEEFGPIINPRLRKMLGVVYDTLGHKIDAVESYAKSIQDYLSLDRIKEAETLHKRIKATKTLSASETKKYDAMEGIISWRKQQISSDNAILKRTMSLQSYLNNTSEVQTKAKNGALPSDFVDVQMFKGLSDLGSQLGDDRALEQQIVYASALNKINNVRELSSEEDYYRTVNANNSLLLSLEQPNRIETVQMYGKELNYAPDLEKSKYNLLTIPTLGKEVVIPKQLILLNRTLQMEYRKSSIPDLAKYKVIDGRFELVKTN